MSGELCGFEPPTDRKLEKIVSGFMWIHSLLQIFDGRAS